MVTCYFFSCGMKKGHFPPNLVKNTFFCPYICVLAYGEANMDIANDNLDPCKCSFTGVTA